MLKYYTLNEIYNILINYIEHNKNHNNIDYFGSIKVLVELLQQIEEEYKNIEE